ncbi:MAG: hypothetical protein AAGA48_37625, partial [Myxococcota bacterium]
PPPTRSALPFDAKRLDATWMVEVVPESAMAPFAQTDGWVTLVVNRDLKQAVAQLGPQGGLSAARAHIEVAALFREAAKLAGVSYGQTYGGTSAQPTDPLGTRHLLTVAAALDGRSAEAITAATAWAGKPDDATAAWHAPWSGWLAASAPWPPDFSRLPVTLPPPTTGVWPEVVAGPQYELIEQSDKQAKRPLGDPGWLLALAEWHEQTALAAAPDHRDAVLRLRVWARPRPDQRAMSAAVRDVPLPLRFGSGHLVSGDVDFLVDVHAATTETMPAVIGKHAPTSIVAALSADAVASGTFDPGRAVDAAAALRTALMERLTDARQGAIQSQDVQFVQIAQTQVLWSLGHVADRLGDREVSGRVYRAAYDASEGATADPVELLSYATWDVGNRYPVRAAQTIYEQSQRIPELSSARLAVDVLNLRVNRENVDQPPN